MSPPDEETLSARVGASAFAVAAQVGGVAILAARLTRRLFPPRVDGPELLRNLYKMGVRSLPIVGVSALVVGAAYTGQALLGVNVATFWDGLLEAIRVWDLATGLIKSALFGLIIALSSSHYGLTVTGGAPGVGRAVNASVVASATGVFISDYFSTYVLH